MKTGKKPPAKKTGKKPPAKVAHSQTTTTRKDRCEWWYERATYPFRDASPSVLENFQRPTPNGGQPEPHWEEAGPHNIAGRVTSLVVHPKAPYTLYAGSAAGGVWRSIDAGQKWSYAWDPSANQNIGALAIHPRDPSWLIVATGEANQSPDTYPGNGFFTSHDGGRSWKPYFTTPDGKISKNESVELPRRVGTIAFDPQCPYNLYGAFGSVTHDERIRAGLYLIRPNEGPVPCICWGLRSYNCHSVVFHPTEKELLFAGIETRGKQNGIWRSTDNGNNWAQLTNGLPDGSEFGRTSLAIAPSSPNVIYALAADRDRKLLGVFRSDDKGEHWLPIASGDMKAFGKERFLSYNNTIVVHPTNPDFVIWGGASLYRTPDAGDTWQKITRPERYPPPYRFTRQQSYKNYVHEDHHALVMPDGNVVYSGNDGGVAVSLDGGITWTDRSRGMVTTMFYAVDVAPTHSKVFGGGAQDNGTLITGVPIGGVENGRMLAKGDFFQAFPGDGGWVIFDPTNEEKVFGSYQNVNVMVHRRKQLWTLWIPAGISKKVMKFGERNQRAIAVLAIEPGEVGQPPRKLWAGTSRLWRTDDDGATWNPVSDRFDGSVISAIEISAADPKIMYVGTTNGGIFRSVDAGGKWTRDMAGGDMARRMVTRIETHPKDPQQVVAVIAATGMASVTLPRFEPFHKGSRASGVTPPVPGVEQATPPTTKSYSLVFQSSDMGEVWKDIDEGALPNVVFNAAAYETRPPYRLFIGGDVGVYVRASNDDGWEFISGNLPNVVVSDLVYHHRDQILTAATYGRGIWRLHTKSLLSGPPSSGHLPSYPAPG